MTYIEILPEGLIVDKERLQLIRDNFALCSECALINEKARLNCAQYCMDEGYYLVIENPENEI